MRYIADEVMGYRKPFMLNDEWEKVKVHIVSRADGEVMTIVLAFELAWPCQSTSKVPQSGALNV